MKCGVLLGGNSYEREISLKSGCAVSRALREKGHNVLELDYRLDEIKEIKPEDFDIIFIALHGGDGENGKIQAIFEEKGIVYTGSNSKSSKIGLDKVVSKELFIENGIPTAPYVILKKNEKIDIKLKVPFVIKPRGEGSSIGLTIVKNKKEIKSAIENAFKYGNEILVEKYIKGREVTVSILDNKVLPIIEIVPANDYFDFDSKYSNKETQYLLPVEIEKDVKENIERIALDVFNVVNCNDYARIDMIIDELNNPYVLEINTIPGFTETSLVPKAAKAIGLEFEDLCERIAELALLRKKLK
jgi:D-alanine-D-alanine ligase